MKRGGKITWEERAILRFGIVPPRRKGVTIRSEPEAGDFVQPGTPDPGTGPTPQRLKHSRGANENAVLQGRDEEGRERRFPVYRMLDGSVLDMLVKRDAITGDQYHAGAQFYADWYYSGLAASGVIDPMKEHVDGAAVVVESDRRLDAMTRYKEAVKALGMSHGIVMQSVVLAEEPLDAFGLRRYGYTKVKLARTAAITALRNALDELDWHYHGKRRQRPSHAHAPGYRPTISETIDTQGPEK